MFKTIRYMRESWKWQKAYDAGAPKVGDEAPDFELRDVNGENPVKLSELRGDKPVGLAFGSFT